MLDRAGKVGNTLAISLGGRFLGGEPFTCAGPGNPEDWIRNAEKVPQKIISDQKNWLPKKSMGGGRKKSKNVL